MKTRKTTSREREPSIGFLGAGKMGGAILRSLLQAKMTSPSAITVCDAMQACREQLVADYGVKAASAETVVAASDVVFLAVKPQDLSALLELLPREACCKPLFISIAAGRRITWIEERLPGARIVRAMPNLGVSAGLGMTAYCGGTHVSEADLRLAEALLGSTGKVCELPEEQLDAVTALSGSGPAFMAYIVQLFAESGVTLGLEKETAVALAVQTMLGTATVLAEEPIDTGAFIRSVTSAKGTTAAGLAVLEKSAVAETLRQTLAAAMQRSRELSRMP